MPTRLILIYLYTYILIYLYTFNVLLFIYFLFFVLFYINLYYKNIIYIYIYMISLTTELNALLVNSSKIYGPQGPQGDAGLAGAAGIDGAVGPQGPQGDAGLDGAAGIAGAVGPQGPQGDAGLDGAAGIDGAVGPQGPQGDAGLDGAVGPALSSSYLYLGTGTSELYDDSNQDVSFGGLINKSLGFTSDNTNIETPLEMGIYFISCSLNGTAVGSPIFDFILADGSVVANTPSFSVPSNDYTGTITTSFIVSLTNALFTVRLSNGSGGNSFTTSDNTVGGTSAFLSIFRIG
jgi:hypothetical protein